MPTTFRKGITLNGQRAQNAGDASSPTDLTTLQQVQGFIRGLDWKAEVVAASTGNVNLAGPGSSLDGVALTAGMQTLPGLGTVTRVLIKDQTDATQNGVYDWNGAAAPLTRSADSDTGTRLSGSTYTVQRGTTNADRVYRVNTDDTITIGTTAVAFGQVGAASAPYTASTGLQQVGQDFQVKPGPGILADTANGTRVDPSVVARKFAADCVANTNPQTFTHGLGTDIHVQVWAGNTELQFADVTKAAANGGQVTVDWGSAPAAGDYRIVVIG